MTSSASAQPGLSRNKAQNGKYPPNRDFQPSAFRHTVARYLGASVRSRRDSLSRNLDGRPCRWYELPMSSAETSERTILKARLDRLARCGRARDETERRLREAATAAREAGATWEQVGQMLGVSRQAACERFGGRRRGGGP